MSTPSAHEDSPAQVTGKTAVTAPENKEHTRNRRHGFRNSRRIRICKTGRGN